MSKEIIRIDCDCGHKGHFFALEKWNGDLLAIVCEADRHAGFWHRLKSAVIFILGWENLNYTEIVLDRNKTLKDIKKAIEKRS